MEDEVEMSVEVAEVAEPDRSEEEMTGSSRSSWPSSCGCDVVVVVGGGRSEVEG